LGEGRGVPGRPRLICGASGSNGREAPRRINDPGDAWGRGGRVGGLVCSRPGRFSACYWTAIGPPTFGPCFGPARRARVAAQALKGHRAGPALSPIDRAQGRASAVLFRVVPRAANRARPIWNSIVTPRCLTGRGHLPYHRSVRCIRCCIGPPFF
jgi:hypothetical protein